MPRTERATKTRDDCRSTTKGYEGCVLSRYKDVKGKDTIGWGHLIDAGWHAQTITQRTADNLFNADFQKALEAARRTLRSWVSVDSAEELVRQWKEDAVMPRYYALIDMAFNLGGTGVRRFRGMLRAWQDGEWLDARDEVIFVDPHAAEAMPTPYVLTTKRRAIDNAYRIAHNKEPVHDVQWERMIDESAEDPKKMRYETA